MIHKIKLTAYVILFSLGILSAQQADDIIGKYHLPNELDIEIYKVGDKYEGKIIALNDYLDGETKDFKNPDKSKRNDFLVGKVIINDLEFDTDDREWVNATMYGPQKGIELNLKVTEMKENEIEVVGSKYFFWRTLTWQKIK